MNKDFSVEKILSNSDAQKKQAAKKSLNNYVNQLKTHFDLNDTEIIKILDSILKSKKRNIIIKKWWQIWK